MKHTEIAILALLTALATACQGPGQEFKAPETIIPLPSKAAITAPPQTITAPPQTFQSPPPGFAAAAGRITLPAAWAASPQLFDSLKLQAGGSTFTAADLFQDIRSGPQGTLTAWYYISPVPERDFRQLTLVARNESSVFLSAWLPPFEEAATAIQDINTETAAVALVKEQKLDLPLADIFDHRRLLEMIGVAEGILASDPAPNLKANRELVQIAIQVAQAVTPSGRQVAGLEISPATLSLVAGVPLQVQAIVRLSDGSTSPRVQWTAFNPGIAMVTATGTLVPFRPGQARFKVSALADPSQSRLLQAEVRQAEAATLRLEALTPPVARIGDEIALTGTGFLPQATTVNFGNVRAQIRQESATSLTVQVPEGIHANQSVTVEVAGQRSNSLSFSVFPTLFSLSSGKGAPGELLAILGQGFSPLTGDNQLRFGTAPVPAADIQQASPTRLLVKIPANAPPGLVDIILTVAGQSSNGLRFRVELPAPGPQLSPTPVPSPTL